MRTVTQVADFPERRKPTVGDARRRAILGALEELLRERPLASINVGDIAGAAGVGRSGFYFYFASKGAAVAAMLGDVFDEMISGSVESLRGTPDPAEAVRAGLENTWRSWREHEGLILAMLDARGGDPAVRDVWEAWIEGFIDPLTAEIDDRRRDATTDGPGPRTRELVAALVGANERAFERLSRAGAGAADVERCIDALTYLWVSTFSRRDP